MGLFNFLRKIFFPLADDGTSPKDTDRKPERERVRSEIDTDTAILLRRKDRIERAEREKRLRAIEDRIRNNPGHRRRIYRYSDDNYYHDSYDDHLHDTDDFEDDY
ncbi:MAG: hypothetical protein K2K68_07985 [Duncaniella sp.]|nr:hypothetical protein [Duncaniella sp.]